MIQIAIQIDAEIQGGIPVFVGTRVPVKTLFDYLEAGDSLATFCEDFPSVPQKLCICHGSPYWIHFVIGILVPPNDRRIGATS